MGADIAGACGQLVVQDEKRTQRDGGIGDIEDSPFHKTYAKSNESEKDDQSLTEKTLEAKLEEYVLTSNGGYKKWVKPLAYATALSSSCFALSLALLLTRRRRY